MTHQDLVAWAEAFQRYSLGLRVSGGPGIMVSETPGGRTISARVFPGGGITNVTAPPGTQWAVTDATVGGVAKVKLGYGTVNDHDPTNSGTAISTNPDVTLAAGTWLYVLTYEQDADWVFVSAIVTMESSMPTATPETKGYKLLATIVSTGSVISSITPNVTYSLGHRMCGNTTHDWWTIL